MTKSKKYLNYLDVKSQPEGNEERYEMLKNIVKNGTFLPKTVEYKDIDASFKEWVDNSLKISYNDKVLPTMVLYSNQRFTEYSQTWQYTDENKNLILNFKTVSRENNPQYGKIQSGLWNIPGNRFYKMNEQIVLDDNGSESLQILKMRQPMAIDFVYKVSIYTTNFETINEFNRIVNDRFKARQDYIFPNGHAMPLILEDISDKSSYEIEDRQFYSQSFSIRVMGYVITEEDYRVEERPIKTGASFHNTLSKRKATVDVEEYVNPCNKPEEEEKYYYRPISIIVSFPNCIRQAEFSIHEEETLFSTFVTDTIELVGARNYKIKINGNEIARGILPTFKDGDDITVTLIGACIGKEAKLSFNGHDPDVAYSYKNDNPEIDADEQNVPLDINVEA